jgi:hypothetical protein
MCRRGTSFVSFHADVIPSVVNLHREAQSLQALLSEFKRQDTPLEKSPFEDRFVFPRIQTDREGSSFVRLSVSNFILLNSTPPEYPNVDSAD